jgi:hypothetical protein
LSPKDTSPDTPPRPPTPSPKTSPTSPPSTPCPSSPSTPPTVITSNITRPTTPPPPPPLTPSPLKREETPGASGDKIVEEYYFGGETIEVIKKGNGETHIETSDSKSPLIKSPSRSSIEPFSRDSLESSPSLQKISSTLIGMVIPSVEFQTK